jgi:hypothetical protein
MQGKSELSSAQMSKITAVKRRLSVNRLKTNSVFRYNV